MQNWGFGAGAMAGRFAHARKGGGMSTRPSAALNLRQVGTASGITMLRQAVAMGIAFVSSVLLARVLGPEGKGIYGVALLLPSTATTLVNLGIAPATVYYVARGDFSPRQVAGNAIRMSIMLSALAIALSLAVTAFASDTLFPAVPVHLLRISLLYIPFALGNLYLLSIIQGLQDFGTYNLIAVTSQACTLAITILLVCVLNLGVAGALVGFSTGHLAGILATIYTLKLRPRLTGRLRIWVGGDYVRKVLSYGLRAHLSNVITFLTNHADLFLVNLYRNPAEAGIYTLAVGLAERLSIVSSSASTVMLPRISELEGSEHLRQELTPIVARHVFLVTLVLSLLAALGARLFVRLIYGEAFESAALVFAALVPSTVFHSLSRVLSSDIAGRGRPQINARIAAVQMAVTIALDFVLIPAFGILGAAMASSIATTVSTLIKTIYYTTSFGITWRALFVFTKDDVERLGRIARVQGAALIDRVRRVLGRR